MSLPQMGELQMKSRGKWNSNEAQIVQRSSSVRLQVPNFQGNSILDDNENDHSFRQLPVQKGLAARARVLGPWSLDVWQRTSLNAQNT